MYAQGQGGGDDHGGLAGAISEGFSCPGMLGLELSEPSQSISQEAE